MAETATGKDKILRYTRIIVGGYDLSGDARTFGTLTNEFAEAEPHGLNEELRHFISNGVCTIGLDSFQCLMNDTANRSMDELKNPSASSRVSILFGGGGEPAIPDPAFLLPSLQMSTSTSFDTSIGVLDVSFIMDSAQWDANTQNPMGVVLANQQYTETTSSGSHDNEAASTAGWHAILQVTATVSGDYAFVIQDGTNDSDWATLGTFLADGSAVTSEHLSGTGTVDRYVRVTATKTTGTATVSIIFARN